MEGKIDFTPLRNLVNDYKERGISMRQLSRRCDISVSYLSRIANGHKKGMSSKTVVKICNGLNCDIEDILILRKDD